MNVSLLPAGSSIDYTGNTVTVGEHRKRAVLQLSDQSQKVIEEYKRGGDIVALSQSVEKLKSLFQAFQMADESRGSSSPRRIAVTSLQDLTAFFEAAVKQKEEAARQQYERSFFESAYSEFSKLEEAFRHEKGSERYFFIQASCLTILLRQENIGEAIKTLLDLEKLGIPHSFNKWHQSFRSAIIEYVKEQFAKNERAFSQLREKINGSAQQIREILSKESLQKNSGFEYFLGLLGPVQQDLDAIGEHLDVCKATQATLVGYYKLLLLQSDSICKNVSDLYDEWNGLNKSAIELLSRLAESGTTEEKNEILREWIASNIARYNCLREQLPALHSWALSLLGTQYFSNDLSEEALEATVALVRTHAYTLFTHFQAFPCDVQLSFGKYHVDMSMLVLATISGRLQRDHCSLEHIRSLQSFSMRKLWDALPVVGKKGPAELPKIELSALMEEKVMHTRDAEGILNQLMTAFSKNQYAFDLEPENVVALFEIAYDLLEMPAEIAALSINPLHTTALEEKLSALLWLRLVQARRLKFPYSSLEERLPHVEPNEFMQFIALYDPKRTEVDPGQHYRLFFAIVQQAEKLFEDRQAFSDKDVVKIFNFLVDLYKHLLELQVEAAIKNRLDTKFIQFGARSVARTIDPKQFSSQDVFKSLAYLDAQALEDIKPLLGQQVTGWLERVVFPHITALVLHQGLYTEGLADFTKCCNITSLTMPLTGEHSKQEVESLSNHFTKLGALELCDGVVEPSSINKLGLHTLSLRNITNKLDFSDAKLLQDSLEVLSLVSVTLEANSLAWVVSARRLRQLSIMAQQNSIIGSLAVAKQAHGHPTLRSISLKIDHLADDAELQRSLIDLIDSQSTITSIALFTECDFALLEYLLRAKKAASVTELALTCNAQENLESLARFTNLAKVTLHTDDRNEAARIQQHNFKPCKLLREIHIVASNGDTISLNR